MLSEGVRAREARESQDLLKENARGMKAAAGRPRPSGRAALCPGELACPTFLLHTPRAVAEAQAARRAPGCGRTLFSETAAPECSGSHGVSYTVQDAASMASAGPGGEECHRLLLHSPSLTFRAGIIREPSECVRRRASSRRWLAVTPSSSPSSSRGSFPANRATFMQAGQHLPRTSSHRGLLGRGQNGDLISKRTGHLCSPCGHCEGRVVSKSIPLPECTSAGP
ncbi:uncharacterized protein LOC117979047 [Pan paniscus]|uniref:uncharacterized protein LOC117979047 n=1 Tax=Pan paniscus TaxID=9597 RepID=UPI0024371806|nr:uncharacterized protein LOC117979047 [Pan paniscus]